MSLASCSAAVFWTAFKPSNLNFKFFAESATAAIAIAAALFLPVASFTASFIPLNIATPAPIAAPYIPSLLTIPPAAPPICFPKSFIAVPANAAVVNPLNVFAVMLANFSKPSSASEVAPVRKLNPI